MLVLRDIPGFEPFVSCGLLLRVCLKPVSLQVMEMQIVQIPENIFSTKNSDPEN